MKIRSYQPQDAAEVGRLIASTYREFNLSHADPEEQDRLLGPFQHAFSKDPEHQKAVASVVASPMLYIAEVNGTIAGVLRGREGVLASLFVAKSYQRQGVGRALVERFEADSRKLGVPKIRVAATLFAIPFYAALGFKKSTGIRPCHSFDGTDLTYQPMKKALS